MSSELRSHRDLVVWQKSLDFAETIYRLTAKFPANEQFGFSMQLRAAATAIPSGIASGAAQGNNLDFADQVSTSLGALAQVETQLELATKLGLLEASQSLTPEILQLMRMLMRLRQSLIEKQ